MQNKENNEEKNIDIKASLESLIQGEKPEVSQEDAIKEYHENIPTNKKNKKASSEEDDDNVDDDHLKRIKQELLESLERVNKLAKLLFSDKNATKLKDIKVKENGDSIVHTQNIEQSKMQEERSREE